MNLNTFFNLIGISVLISGAFIAARGFFTEKDKNLMIRTTLQFGNDEHFKSMLNQKYSEIFGFGLIMIGSGIQFISYFLNNECVLLINDKIALPTIVAGMILVNFIIILVLRLIVRRRHDLVTINGWIKHYEDLLPIKDSNKSVENGMNNALEQILKILKKRYPKFANSDPKEIIDFAKGKFKYKNDWHANKD